MYAYLVQCRAREISAEMIVGVFDEGISPRINSVHNIALRAEVLNKTLDGVELSGEVDVVEEDGPADAAERKVLFVLVQKFVQVGPLREEPSGTKW